MKQPTVVLLCCILVLGCRSSVNADIDPTDVSVLMGLYSSLNSPSQLTQWSSAVGDPCRDSWKGIKCSGPRVTEIVIPGLGLTGSLGYSLDKLTSVTNFDISNNNLVTPIPYQLPPNVQQLNLAANGFDQELPYSISLIWSLKYLNVSHNQIQGDMSEIFGNLSSLSTLDFSFNTMTGDLPKTFRNLTNMNKMYLENNQFTGTIDVLSGLPLTNLNVENNRLSGWIPNQLKGINLQADGNMWSLGPAPPPPSGQHDSGGKNKPSDGGGGGGGGSTSSKSGKSGIGVGGIAPGIVLCVSLYALVLEVLMH